MSSGETVQKRRDPAKPNPRACRRRIGSKWNRDSWREPSSRIGIDIASRAMACDGSTLLPILCAFRPINRPEHVRARNRPIAGPEIIPPLSRIDRRDTATGKFQDPDTVSKSQSCRDWPPPKEAACASLRPFPERGKSSGCTNCSCVIVCGSPDCRRLARAAIPSSVLSPRGRRWHARERHPSCRPHGTPRQILGIEQQSPLAPRVLVGWLRCAVCEGVFRHAIREDLDPGYVQVGNILVSRARLLHAASSAAGSFANYWGNATTCEVSSPVREHLVSPQNIICWPAGQATP